MLFLSMFSWWYTKGWRMFLHGMKDRLKNAADFFSIRLLVRNMFQPFKQISANEQGGADLGSKFSAFTDRLFSRIIGTIVRLFMLIIGTILIILEVLVGGIIAIVWPLAPALAVGCVVLAIMGVGV